VSGVPLIAIARLASFGSSELAWDGMSQSPKLFLDWNLPTFCEFLSVT
jgi:hypothetical protein